MMQLLRQQQQFRDEKLISQLPVAPTPMLR
jgi:hypothetical protein